MIAELRVPNWRKRSRWMCGACLASGILVLSTQSGAQAPQPAAPFGGAYTSLEARRQHLVDDWVGRFNAVTGQQVAPGPFYDDLITLSAKTTFDAVTNALMRSTLTDSTGAPLGDALSLVERVDIVHGQIAGTRGDNQFRMYVQLTAAALTTLDRAKEFKREADNTIYHKGYPINYREEGGTPSIQISVAVDGRRGDIDVDYRSSSFPTALFNGHLTAANSDVRADDNFERHNNRWAGFENWWRSFFGVHLDRAPEVPDQRSPFSLPAIPRAGKANIDAMVKDFLNAWLIEGNVIAAMGYVSPRSYACLARKGAVDDVDSGVAPYQLMVNLKAAYDALGPHTSLDGLTTGVRLPLPALKVIAQPSHAQFVVYSVPDDVAIAFDCKNRLGATDPQPVKRKYGTYSGATFYIRGRQDSTVALLWARENGYWKIVSWQTGIESRQMPPPDAPPDVTVARIPAEPSLVQAAHSFLESWFIRKDYDSTFRYLSERSYACYDLTRRSEDPAATSPADAAQKIRAAIERAGRDVGSPSSLTALLTAAPPVHPATRLMDHRYSQTFALTSLPTALADVSECTARARGDKYTGVTGSDYGTAFGMNFRFVSAGDGAGVLRTLWRRENGSWRITSYGVETP